MVLNQTLITETEEHAIRLQDADVAAGTTTHVVTIALLRQLKDQLVESAEVLDDDDDEECLCHCDACVDCTEK